jgi:hypothetical protein
MFRQRLRRTVKIVDRLLAEDDLDMDGLIRQELQPIQYNVYKSPLNNFEYFGRWTASICTAYKPPFLVNNK